MATFPTTRRFLLVYPEFKPTMWGLQYTLPLIAKKSLVPPLGLLTIAALTPPEYDLRVVDLNCEPLTDAQLDWADAVLLSAMLPQKDALFRAADRARARGKFVVMGGPYPTACPEECRPHCDALVLNEGEITWPQFLRDLEAGRPKDLYQTDEKADMTKSPAPRFDLLNLSHYTNVPLQFARGCPFQCEFCDIIVMLGRVPRLKTVPQFIHELDLLYATGYRGQVGVVDDNFIGNGREVRLLLKAMNAWNAEHGHPFHYFCQATVNLADDDALLEAVAAADFTLAFLGIESPSMDSLKETRKFQNTNHPLLDRVRKIQAAGIQVMAGFIVGFDNDPENIFEAQRDFIARAAIPNVYISPLVALPGTPLFDRMRKEGRLIPGEETKHTFISGYTNIRYRRPMNDFLDGHRRLLESVYHPRAYFERAVDTLHRFPAPVSLRDRGRIFQQEFHQVFRLMPSVREAHLKRKSVAGGILGLARSAWRFFRGVPGPVRREIPRFFWNVLRSSPQRFPWVIHHVCMEIHFYRLVFEMLIPELDQRRAALAPETTSAPPSPPETTV